jgi:hypothetical protein
LPKVKTKTFAPRRRGDAERNRNLPRIDADERGSKDQKKPPLINTDATDLNCQEWGRSSLEDIEVVG